MRENAASSHVHQQPHYDVMLFKVFQGLIKIFKKLQPLTEGGQPLAASGFRVIASNPKNMEESVGCHRDQSTRTS